MTFFVRARFLTRVEMHPPLTSQDVAAGGKSDAQAEEDVSSDPSTGKHPAGEGGDRRALLARAIDHAAHYLPAQAPLEVFVHHNTLHAFEHLPFHEAVDAAARIWGARAYLPEERYRAAFASGRITAAEVDAALADLSPAGAAMPPGFPPATEIARLVLLHGVGGTTPANLAWLLSEKGVANRFSDDTDPLARERIVIETLAWLREKVYGDDGVGTIARLVSGDEQDDPIAALGRTLGVAPQRASLRQALDGHGEQVAVRALWTACRELSRGTGAPARPRAPRFLPERVAAVSHEDPDDRVHPLLITLSGAFLDRGQSHWSMPDREEGFFVAWRRVLTAGRAVRPSWLSTLGERLRDGIHRGVDAVEAIWELFDEIGLADRDVEAFVEHMLLRLPGWAGMFHRLERAPGPLGRAQPRIRLVDFLAVRLTLDVLAWADIGRRLGYRGPLRGLSAHCARLPAIAPERGRGDHDTAWPLFRVAQLAGVSAPVIHRAGREGALAVVRVLDAFDERARKRVWHEAYERHYRDEPSTRSRGMSRTEAPFAMGETPIPPPRALPRPASRWSRASTTATSRSAGTSRPSPGPTRPSASQASSTSRSRTRGSTTLRRFPSARSSSSPTTGSTRSPPPSTGASRRCGSGASGAGRG